MLCRELCCDSVRGRYVDISDRLNDKMDEIMDYQNELDNWKTTAKSWQQKAMQAATVTPRGSAMDAIPVRKAELLSRTLFSKLYAVLQDMDKRK